MASLANPPVIKNSGLRWRVSRFLSALLLPRLAWAERLGLTLTVENGWEMGMGDAVSAASLVRQIRDRFPHLRINVVTRHADLMIHDPAITSLNARPTLLHLTYWYPELLLRKARSGSIFDEASAALGGMALEYRAKIFLSPAERAWGAQQLQELPAPRIAFSTRSGQDVKNWPEEQWAVVVRELNARGIPLIHLGDDREPIIPGARRLAGKLSKRESLAILSATQLFLGADSFLMHAANGLDIRSVIIFGGSRPAACFGYSGNENLDVTIDCGPCWIHGTKGEVCPREIACMQMISPEMVLAAVDRLLRSTAGVPLTDAPGISSAPSA